MRTDSSRPAGTSRSGSSSRTRERNAWPSRRSAIEIVLLQDEGEDRRRVDPPELLGGERLEGAVDAAQLDRREAGHGGGRCGGWGGWRPARRAGGGTGGGFGGGRGFFGGGGRPRDPPAAPANAPA